MTRNSVRTLSASLALGAALLGAAVALSGCSAVDELVYKQRSLTFDDVTQLRADGGPEVPWMPADSTAIEIVQSTQGADSVVRVRTEAALDPASCTAGSRLSGPAYTMEDAPEVYTISEAYVCGEWTVVADDGGWYGWTPNSPEERAQG